MISSVLNSYFTILLSIGVGSLMLFIFGLYLIFRPAKKTVVDKIEPQIATAKLLAAPEQQEPCLKSTTKLVVTSQDISAISGEDVISTQLDLARAYIETGKTQLAKKILDYVEVHGDIVQQDEAQRLLGHI